MTKPRQLAPTVGPAHGGVEFSKGALPGSGSYAAALMTWSRRGIAYIDNRRWGPEANSLESGYRVPFGKINVFIGMIGSPVPEPDTSSDIVEPARYVHPVITRNLTTSDSPGLCGVHAGIGGARTRGGSGGHPGQLRR